MTKLKPQPRACQRASRDLNLPERSLMSTKNFPQLPEEDSALPNELQVSNPQAPR